MNKLWVIEYDSQHWCGGSSNCLVWAENEDEAQDIACEHMDSSIRDLFMETISECIEEGFDDECDMHNVVSVELATESEDWEFISDHTQQINFYPLVNPDAGVSLEFFIRDFNQTWPFPTDSKP